MDNSKIEKNQRICSAFQKNAHEGINLLFDTYYQILVVWADSFVHDMNISEDIVQDFFVDVWHSNVYKTFRSQTLSSYLYVSVRNRCLKKIAKKDVFNQTIELGDREMIMEEYNKQHDVAIVKILEEIDQLPERSRQIMHAVFVQGLKYAEVAEKYNISLSTVKTLLHSSIVKLRKHLDKQEFADFLFFFTVKM